MFKAIANWFKGLFGKAEQQVAKDSQIVDQWNEWNRVIASTPAAKVEEVKHETPVVLEETVKPAPAKKSTSRKSTTKPASKTTKTSTKTSKAPAQKAAPKSKTTKTTK